MEKAAATLSEAERTEQEFKEFMYIISHDFSAPLRAIVEFSRILSTEHAQTLNDEGLEYLSLVKESGEKLQNMLRGLLDYSRLNTTAQPFSEVDCNATLSHCLAAMKAKIDASKAKIEFGALPVVHADAKQWMQLFTILLDNALKFHAEGSVPCIHVSAEQESGEWKFTIRDNGIGVEKDFWERIFKPFQRLHSETEYTGTGMGLALAKKIVAHHKGRLWVESTPEKGSCFIFTIPYKE